MQSTDTPNEKTFNKNSINNNTAPTTTQHQQQHSIITNNNNTASTTTATTQHQQQQQHSINNNNHNNISQYAQLVPQAAPTSHFSLICVKVMFGFGTGQIYLCSLPAIYLDQWALGSHPNQFLTFASFISQTDFKIRRKAKK